jgi:hypothetical protein
MRKATTRRFGVFTDEMPDVDGEPPGVEYLPNDELGTRLSGLLMPYVLSPKAERNTPQHKH